MNDARTKKRLLLGLLAYSAFVGAVAAVAPEENAVLDTILGLPLLFMGILWCHADARQRQQHLGRVMKISLVLLFAIAFPIYVLKSRGLAGIKTLFCAALFGALLCGVSFLAASAVALLTGSEVRF